MHHVGMTEAEVLNGPRVTLRAPTLDDAEPLFERIASDPEVPRYMSWRVHPDVDETRRVITELFNVGRETTWLIDLRDGTGVIEPSVGGGRSRISSTSATTWAVSGGGRASCRRRCNWCRQGATRSHRVSRLGVLLRRQHGVGADVERNGLTSKAAWRAMRYCRTSAPNRRTACSSPRRSLMLFEFKDLEKPVIVAPMAGGRRHLNSRRPGQTQAAWASSGRLSDGAGVAERLGAARRWHPGRWAQSFVPQASAARPTRSNAIGSPRAGHRTLRRHARRASIDDDAWAAKIDVLLDLRPDVASFTFGLPSDDECTRLRQRVSRPWAA